MSPWFCETFEAGHSLPVPFWLLHNLSRLILPKVTLTAADTADLGVKAAICARQVHARPADAQFMTVAGHHGPRLIRRTRTFVYSMSPSRADSTPIPDCLMPPKGTSGDSTEC